jgi:hypothetical protein
MTLLNSMGQSTSSFIHLPFLSENTASALLLFNFKNHHSRPKINNSAACVLKIAGATQHQQNGPSKQQSTKKKGFKGKRETPWLLRFFSRDVTT